MSIKRTCAISSSISFLTSAAICLHEQCANPCLTSSEEQRSELTRQRKHRTPNIQHPTQNSGTGSRISGFKKRYPNSELPTSIFQSLRRGRSDEFFEARIATQ